MGSGLLNIFPIHASGYHDITPPQTVLDRVISFYAPTVKSLAYARTRATVPDEVIRKEKAAIVAMPVTPERTDLLFVEREVMYLENLFSGASINMRVMRNPTRREVLSALPQFGIAHFSCHGISATDPSQSSLLLKDWKTLPLTVSDLASLNIKSAKFAYLSACHASAIRNEYLLDESISLSSAIQLSGYASVVGTLWQVSDIHSAQIAKDVYEWILKDVGFNAERAAEGLHKAVHDLRARTHFTKMHDPFIWAPYVHIGA